MTTTKKAQRQALAVKRVAKLIGYGCSEQGSIERAAMTTGLSIADVRAAWTTR